MKRLNRFSLVAVIVASTFATGAVAAERWVKVLNNTTVVMYRFYASPSNRDAWGRDRLGRRQIPPGYNSRINLSDAPRGCTFDFRAEFKDGDVLEKWGVNVCGGHTITYHE